ncbi:DUF4179 domain-containing protein [Paenibacillus macerans]|uniref:DUF4179 domain-containing protein n=1 Tax=Paenibacillus macerans TaxID=44252 RepID=UPI002E1A8861|nr:DUF4179 domain-containing protein [Paenibacillus macerans]
MDTRDLEKTLRDIRKQRMTGVSEVPDIIRRRQDEVYASLADLPMQTRSGRTSRISRTFKVGAAAAAAIAVLTIGLGSAMVSPALAESLKNVPILGGIFKLAGDLGLQTAEERGLAEETDASVTHDGITLRIPQVVYDGIRLTFAVKREGEGFTGGILDHKFVGEGRERDAIYPRGAVRDWDMLIDGKPTYNSKNHKFSSKGGPTADPNAALYELSAISETGDSSQLFPDRFVLTAKFWLEGIEEPFVFELPVRKNADRLVETFGETREWSGITLTLEQIQYTPITTKVVFDINVEDKASRPLRNNLLFDLCDDQGRNLGLVGGVGIYYDNGQMHARYEMLFDRLQEVPDTITLKPFQPEYADPSTKPGESGAYKVDSNGKMVKHYVKELEITVPVNRAGLEKLYGNQN